MSIIFYVFATIIGIIIFFKTDTCYYPLSFFFIKYVAGNIIDFERVRNQVVFQLMVITLIFIVVIIKNKGKVAVKDFFFYKIIFLILAFLVFNSLLGMIDGHSLFQILIDSYKYLEIIVFYFLFRICWKNNQELLKGIKGLSIFMLCVGIIEIFTTNRGGVGLNLIMSLMPMALLLSINNYINGYKLIFAVSLLVVVTCQTRTYIIGFALGLLFLIGNLSYEKRNKILKYVSVIFIVLFFMISFFNVDLFSNTISRFLELSDGFSESGGYRIDEYAIALKKFIESPIFGNGFGYLKHMNIPKMGWMDWGDFIHCIYIEILFKTGLFGFINIVVIFGSFTKKILQQAIFYKNKNKFIFSICFGGICSFISWLFTYAFAPLTTYGSMFVGVIISSIALSNYYIEQRKEIKRSE